MQRLAIACPGAGLARFVGIVASLCTAGASSAQTGAQFQEHAADPAPVAIYGPPAPDNAPGVAYRAPPGIPDALNAAALLAVRNHPAVLAAEAEADALSADLRGARAGYYPRLTVEALAATSGSSFADRDGLALNAVVEQPLWAGGRIDGQVARARAGRDAGADRVKAAQRRMLLQTIDAYERHLLAENRLAVLQASLVQHQTLLASIGRRVAQEVSPLADLSLGRSRAAQVEIDIATARELRDNAQLRLFELTGSAEVRPVAPSRDIIAMLPAEETALADTLACDPDLGALGHAIEMAAADNDIARAQVWPQLLAQLSQNEITGARAALVVRMQLGNGVSQLAAIEGTEARQLRALAQFGEAERQAREELRRDYIMVRAFDARIAAGALAANAAEELVASYQRQFVAGRRSWLDVMNGVREAASARLAEGDARIMTGMGAIRILARTCRWQPLSGDIAP